ncbi:hypothetical protein AAHC03_013855 [Spirometra sp. Aus1]
MIIAILDSFNTPVTIRPTTSQLYRRKFVLQAQDLLNENRRLFQELHHLKCSHGGGSLSCPPPLAPVRPVTVPQQYDALPALNSPVSHAECDRRNAELEDEIDRLKRERSKLRMQGDSIQDLARAISQKQAALRQEISQYQALERENATQHELLMKLASERDSMVQVLKERDRSFSDLLGSVKTNTNLTRRNTCDLIAKERELEALIQRLVGMSENIPRNTCENERSFPRVWYLRMLNTISYCSTERIQVSSVIFSILCVQHICPTVYLKK